MVFLRGYLVLKLKQNKTEPLNKLDSVKWLVGEGLFWNPTGAWFNSRRPHLFHQIQLFSLTKEKFRLKCESYGATVAGRIGKLEVVGSRPM